jgi:hypothetical protein
LLAVAGGRPLSNYFLLAYSALVRLFHLRAFLKSAFLLVPPVHRLYLQRNLALAERDRVIAELEHERRNSGLSYHRGAHEDQTRVIQLFRLFSPVAVISAPMIRIGRMADSGYVMADCFTGTRAAFSFGIAGEVSWDCDIAQRNIAVYQYDNSVETPPLFHPRFVFYKKAIRAERNATSESIASVLAGRQRRRRRRWVGLQPSSRLRPGGNYLLASGVNVLTITV